MALELQTLPLGGFAATTPEQQQIWWQQFKEAIEKHEAGQDATLAAIQALQTQQTAILADLSDQLAQIVQAQADATAAARETARINSYPQPGVGILSASDAGTDATITVIGHTRVYPVQGSVAVPPVTFTNTPFQITGLAYSTRYWVYYDDPTLANTEPTFLATTSSSTAQVGAAAGRHFVGFVDTPAPGGGSTSGGGGAPPGGGGGGSGGAIP